MPLRARLRKHNHPDHAPRAAVPSYCLPERVLDKIHAFCFGHVLFPVGVAVAVDVGAAGAADCVGLFVEGAAEGDAVDLRGLLALGDGLGEGGLEGGGNLTLPPF